MSNYQLTLLFSINAWQKVRFDAADDDAARAYGKELADAIRTGDGIPDDHAIEDEPIETDWDGFEDPTVIVDAYADDGGFRDEIAGLDASKPDPVRDAAPAMLAALEANERMICAMFANSPESMKASLNHMLEDVRAAIRAARGEG